MRVYLAAPFFTPEQVRVVERLERAIEDTGNQLYSPRTDGVLSKMSLEDRALSKRKIFDTNCREIAAADMVLAVVDGRDQGVTWEIGYAHGLRDDCGGDLEDKLIVTYTDQNYGLNVMIQECVDAHCRGMAAALDVLTAAKRERGDSKVMMTALARHQDFDPRVT